MTLRASLPAIFGTSIIGAHVLLVILIIAGIKVILGLFLFFWIVIPLLWLGSWFFTLLHLVLLTIPIGNLLKMLGHGGRVPHMVVSLLTPFVLFLALSIMFALGDKSAMETPLHLNQHDLYFFLSLLLVGLWSMGLALLYRTLRASQVPDSEAKSL
jgi:hypothetical protein